jgi:beta-N-acetylhexosaminidase
MQIADVERLAGRVVIAGFDGFALPTDLRRAARDAALGGIVLFGRNVESPSQVAALLGELRNAATDDVRPIAAIDQEGGRVVRVREPLTVLPPARRFGEVDDPELTRRAGLLVGRELRALGLTLNLAPVLDVDTNPASPVIGDRSYGPNPETVARHGLAFARGLVAGGVYPCAKHFPGHGDAVLDSHLALPRVEHDAHRLQSVEVAPFAAWAHEAPGPVMSAHVVFPALDAESPATVSQKILTGLLREQLGFDGAVLTDDLEMGAIGEVGGPAEAAVSALDAGADGLLVCRSAEVRGAVIQAIARAAVDRPRLARRLDRAAGRLRRLGSPTGAGPGAAWIGSPEHLKLGSEVRSGLES